MKSKKQSKTTTGKSQLDEPPVFFLDRTFGKTKLVEMLRPHDFIIVTHYEEYGDEGHNLGDPAIIQDCGLKNRVLLTGDQDLIHTYAREIREARIAVFVTTDNQEGPDKWAPRIISAKRHVARVKAKEKALYMHHLQGGARLAGPVVRAGRVEDHHNRQEKSTAREHSEGG